MAEFEFKIIWGCDLGFIHHHHHLPPPMSQVTNLPTVFPSPLLGDMGTITSIHSKDPSSPLLSTEGYG